jgi:hypothetical protein
MEARMGKTVGWYVCHNKNLFKTPQHVPGTKKKLIYKTVVTSTCKIYQTTNVTVLDSSKECAIRRKR